MIASLNSGAGAETAPRYQAQHPAPQVLAAGESIRFPLSLRLGDYVTGQVRAVGPAGPFLLQLQDGDGQMLRQFEVGPSGAARVFFVAGSDDEHLVAVSQGGSPATLVWQQMHHIPAADQTGRPVTLDSPNLSALQAAIAAGQGVQQAIDQFWQDRSAEGTPMLEPSERPGHQLVTFLWRGATKNVRLWGGPSHDHTWMQQLSGSDIWYASFEVPDTARLSYGFAPDVPQFDGGARDNRVALLATLQADPLNRHPLYPEATDPFAQRSQLVLAAAPDQPGMVGPLPDVRGKVQRQMVTSTLLGNSRAVDVYTPPGFDPADPETKLLVLFDGPSYQDARAPVPDILDRLITSGQLPPVVALLVDPIDGAHCAREMPCNAAFNRFITEELIPGQEAQLGLSLSAADRVVSGSSFGGLASICLLQEQAFVVGNAVAMSPSLWWAPPGHVPAAAGRPYVIERWMQDSPAGVHLWMSAGTYEVGRRPGEVSILEPSRTLRDVMALRPEVQLTYREYVGGHDYLIWRGSLAEGLLALFGR